MIRAEGTQYRISSPMLLLFSAPFTVWQMGVLFYSGTAMSLSGRTPITLSETGTMAVIAAGYIVSMLFMSLFPRLTVWAERILMPVALTATALILLPFSPVVITVLFYTEVFICTFSIGAMVLIAAGQFTAETTWRDGIIGMSVGGVLIALLQNEVFKVDFTVFTVMSVLFIAMQTVFYYRIPSVMETRYVSRENKIKMPKILFSGLWVINIFSTLLLCLASSFAESVPHGISIFYISAAFMSAVLHLLRQKLGGGSVRIFSGFFALSILGFVLAYLSLSVPVLRYVAVILLAFNAVLAALWIYFAAVSFRVYPTRFIGVIGAGMGIAIAAFHSGLQSALRDNTALLYGIYAALSVGLLLIYFFLEPYFTYAWKTAYEPGKTNENKPDEPGTATETVMPIIINRFDCLSEQENILANLILDGHTESSAARIMNITLNTEKGYRKSLYFKLDIHSKRELFEIANRK